MDKNHQRGGAKYAVFVCKHHDGFANWPSKYTDYSVANTPWKDGKGDVAREFVNACRKYDIKVGLYYSPAKFGSANKDAKDYDEYFVNQISELLTNYVTFDYLWFDGCGSENHKYDEVRIIKAIRDLQPNILIFNMWDPDTRWVGSEAGYAHLPSIDYVDALSFSVQTDRKDSVGEMRFLPVECDFRMRRHNWFYSDSDEPTVKTLDKLMGIYYYSVGRGANMLINIGPDRRGLLPKKDSQRLLECRREVKRRVSSPIQRNTSINDNTYTLEFDLQLISHVVLEEDLSRGGVIKSFVIKAYPYNYGEPITVYHGTSVFAVFRHFTPTKLILL